MDQENGADSVDDSDSLGNSGSKKNNLTPTSAAPSSGSAQKDKKRPFFKKVNICNFTPLPLSYLFWLISFFVRDCEFKLSICLINKLYKSHHRLLT